jgi:hypothetical protein
MAKRMCLSLTTVAVLAFTMPAMASATTGLTENGSFVAHGTEILTVNNGPVDQTLPRGVKITCTSLKLHSLVEINSTTEFRASTAAGSSASGCSTESGASVPVPTITLSELRTTGEVISGSTKKANFKLSFQEKIGSATCNFTVSAGEATYLAGGSELIVSEQPVTGSPAVCGNSKLDGKLRLTTVSGIALTLD